MKKFEEFLKDSYGKVTDESVKLGKAKLDKIYDMEVSLPLAMLNRHGLIAGTTGTGKSRAAQLIAEQLSDKGVPVIFSDVKGDVSNFTNKGDKEKVKQRLDELKKEYSPEKYPCTYWSISDKFIPFKVKLRETDPVFLSKLMALNMTQESHLNILFIQAREQNFRLADLSDLETLVEYAKANKLAGLDARSLDVIQRKIIELKASGFDRLFGNNPIKISDLLGRIYGKGLISVFNLSDIRESPRVFTVAMAFLLHRLFRELEDIGDQEKPRIAVFFDEAHYLFKNSNRTLIELIATILRQIRTKGVSVFFVTQQPQDIPEEVLGMLGFKIQFALRAFTKRDSDNIRYLVKGFPTSDFYKLENELKKLEVGEAMIAALDNKGRLLPPVKTVLYPPRSSMEQIDTAQISAVVRKTPLYRKYSKNK